MYVKIKNNVPAEWPVSEARIRYDNSSTSFPRDMSSIDVSEYGFAPFQFSDLPDYDPEYQNCDEITPVLSDGIYVQTWQVSDKYNATEKSAYDSQKEQERISTLPEIQRMKRNLILQDTDWWAVSDRTMTSEQTAYRQALRDITAHANWPDLADDDWPTKP